MTIKEIHNLAIQMGIQSDFRGESGVKRFLDVKKEQYEKMNEKEKEGFNIESLENPYLDSGIHNISEDKNIKKVLVGVDIDTAELLLAKQLKDIDLVICHHPIGKSLAYLSDVMHLQCDVLNYYGVPINIAEGLMRERIDEVSRGTSSKNHQKVVDSAKLLDINLMNVHTPCDNLAAQFLKIFIDSKQPRTLGELMDTLKRIPEYREAMKVGSGPKIFVGAPENRCGKIALTEITGGTEGSPKLFAKMADAGIGTIVGMHISEEGKKQAEEAHINVVIAGHISSDSLGINLFLDELEKRGVQITPYSGLIRISRL